MAALCDAECGELLRALWRERGIEATVTTEPPMVLNPYLIEGGAMRCPHGLMWFMEPTSDQIAQWVKDGVE